MYMNIHVKHTHTIDIVYYVFISKGGTIWTQCQSLQIPYSLLIETSFFSFPLIICEEQTLIITKCVDVVPRFVQHDAHALVFMAISAFSG